MNGKITKYDLVNSIHEKLGYTKDDLLPIVDCMLEEMKYAINNGNQIELRGFGTFELKLRKGREKARNPKTGETVSFPSHYIPVFRPGKEMKETVKNIVVKEK